MDEFMENIVGMFKEERRKFFRGELARTEHTDNGKVRIVPHGTIESLEVEPVGGGQFIIAVRAAIPSIPRENLEGGTKYQGYYLSDSGFVGVNTLGH